MGIAVSTGIDTANKSALNGFKYSMDAVTGKAVGHIISPSSGIESKFYFDLRKNGIKNISPVVETSVKVKNRTYILFGTDPFASQALESRYEKIEYLEGKGITSLISDKNSVIISEKAANDLGLNLGDIIFLDTGNKEYKALIIGIIKKNKNAIIYDNIILTDISSAQEITKKNRTISRVDIFDEDTKLKIEPYLKNGLKYINAKSRSDTTRQMVEAFQINLSALSLLALIVGLYLIYNTMSFSIVRRQSTIGIYSSIGVYNKEIFLLVIIEALMLGIPGTIIGLLMGLGLAKGLVFLVSRSLNDLYFALSVSSIDIELMIFIKGLLLGTFASVLAGLKPAFEAVRLPAAFSMKRSFQEERLQKRIPVFILIGSIMLIITGIIISIDTKNLLIGYSSFGPLIIGFTLLAPIIIILSVNFFSYFFRKSPIIYRMGINSIYTSLSRTGIAITALALAVSASVGVSITINSFRNTVLDWLDQRIGADLYISAPGLISLRNDTPVPDFLLDEIKKIDEVKRINFYREKEIFLNDKKVRAAGISFEKEDQKRFKFIKGGKKADWENFEKGSGVFVSEPFALKNSIKTGKNLNIPTISGLKKYKVMGIYTDYSSDQGVVSFDYDEFSKIFNTNELSGISIFLKDKKDIERVRKKIVNLSLNEKLIISSNLEIRKTSMEIFDRTFAVANILQIISIIVAFTGIVSALMSLMLEKSKEIGTLRALGFYPSQIRKKIHIQTLFMGIISGLMSLPLGHIFSWLLINVINKRAFGWSLDFAFSLEVIIKALLVSIIASIAAGIYPAFKMSKISPAQALREE